MRRYLKGCAVVIGIPLLIFALHVLDAEDIPWRTYTIEAGSYTGRVVDEKTGQPIAGAAVYMACSSRRDLNLLESIGYFESPSKHYYIGESLTFTDAQGYYQAPDTAFRQKLNLRADKPIVEMLIYKQGYVGYNSEVDFDGVNNLESKQPLLRNDHAVKLRPWPKTYAWSRHFDYMHIIYFHYRSSKYQQFKDLMREQPNAGRDE